MTDIDTLACDVHKVADGVLVIPHLLPIRVPVAALTLTVEEWIGAAPA
ncbi:MAG TPA: hypothetical protein VMZ00_09170 [Sporichthya sp.]|nr:hypothetical protein [Sporichthya sp.]